MVWFKRVSIVAMSENSQRHLGGSGLNQAMRGEWEGESERGNQESVWPKYLDHVGSRGKGGRGLGWGGVRMLGGTTGTESLRPRRHPGILNRHHGHWHLTLLKLHEKETDAPQSTQKVRLEVEKSKFIFFP